MNKQRRYGIRVASVVVALVMFIVPMAGADDVAERRITLNVPKADVREALRLVAEHGGLNLTIGPDVQGEVSVYLTNATIDTALKAIARNANLDYTIADDIVSVKKRPDPIPRDEREPPVLVTRVFTLQSADAARVRDALQYALSPDGKMEVFNENSGGLYNTLSLSQLEGEVGASNTNNVNNVNNNAGRAGNGQVNQRGGGGGGVGGVGGVQAFARNARRLVVTDIADNMGNIADLIATLDTMPPQVLIEARIVEMTTDLQRQLGIDWDINVLASGPVLNHEFPLQLEAGFASGNQIRRTANGTANAGAGLALGVVDFSRLIGLLRIHESDNAIRLLANPRLLVFNNHSASILVGERYPILESNISEFGIVTESLSTYIPVGIQLEVQPTIMLNGRISMMIHPVTSALGDDVVGTTGIRVARIRTRELSTRIIMDDGQTIALGGLISDRKARNVNKIPGLGDILGLSALFRQENPTSERIDLIVFVTAHIEGASTLTDRDRKVLDMYEPHFKEIQRLQDVQLHHEVPTEYSEPRPMYGDPVVFDGSPSASRSREGGRRIEPGPSDDIDMIQRHAPPAARPQNDRMRITRSPDVNLMRTMKERRQQRDLRRTAVAREAD